MTRYKLIAADLDDTFLDDNLEISSRNREAFRLAREKGLTVTIATGRMFRSALPIARSLGIDGPIITYQGALVKNVSDGEILTHRPVPLKDAKRVLAEGYKAGIHMNVYINDSLYVDKITEESQGYAEQSGVDPIPVGNLIEFLAEEPTKILYIAKPDLLDRLQRELTDQFGESLYITKSKPYYLEFMHPHATKMHALQQLAHKLGILPEEIIAFGDSYNDIEMIEYAGLGVAMANAPEEIKVKAKMVTTSNNDDGVARVIEEFVLNKQ